MGNRKCLLIVLILVVILGLVIGVFFYNKTLYTIKYKSLSEYVLSVKRNYIKIDKYDVVECIKAPCDPVKSKSFKVKYNKKYKVLIESLFRNTDNNKITISSSELDNDDLKVMSEIVKDGIKKSKFPYKIIDSDYYDTQYEERGYYVLEDDKVVIISMGLKGTGGYEISVNEIVEDDNTVKIYVNEISPGSSSVVTEAITVPTVRIQFYKLPENIIVYSNSNLDGFKKIK